MKHLMIISALALCLFACSDNSNKQANANETNTPKKLEKTGEFVQTNWEALDFNVVELFGNDWALVAAGKLEDYNMMTVSWGSWGWLWETPVSNIYVRPQRHTHNYTEKSDYYTICFFDDEDKEVLRKMGTVSGRDFDKMHYEKLTAFETENGSIAFEEAWLIVECRKIYATLLNEEDFVDRSISDHVYPEKDFHTHYVGEITNVWIKEN